MNIRNQRVVPDRHCEAALTLSFKGSGAAAVFECETQADVADENLSDCARAYVLVLYNERTTMNFHCDAYIRGEYINGKRR